MKKSKALIMLEHMDNWQELSNVQLNNLLGWRFWAKIYLLKSYWVRFLKRKWEWYTEYFTIIYIPKNLIYKWRNSIKVIREKTLIEKFKNLFK